MNGGEVWEVLQIALRRAAIKRSKPARDEIVEGYSVADAEPALWFTKVIGVVPEPQATYEEMFALFERD